MSRLSIGILNYGVGNLASMRHCLQSLDFRCRISDDVAVLTECDLLLLPGVGAFPLAMKELNSKGLDKFLIKQALIGKPIVGICLGMQMLAEASHEGGYTKGLGLIPGEVVPLDNGKWHIGWNSVDKVSPNNLFDDQQNNSFYFNHSFAYCGPQDFVVGQTCFNENFPSIIQYGKIIGIQFHPEKSQFPGHKFLSQIIRGLCNA